MPANAVRECKTMSGADAAALTGLWSKVELLIHEGEQLLPTGEVEIAGQRSQVVEKGAPGRQFSAYHLIH